MLHGPPGVGKTLTAETIAERTQKVLLRIDIGELTAESDMINRLRKIFDNAARWDAVLLLDEWFRVSIPSREINEGMS